jgi:hypothetical protein
MVKDQFATKQTGRINGRPVLERFILVMERISRRGIQIDSEDFGFITGRRSLR